MSEKQKVVRYLGGGYPTFVFSQTAVVAMAIDDLGWWLHIVIGEFDGRYSFRRDEMPFVQLSEPRDIAHAIMDALIEVTGSWFPEAAAYVEGCIVNAIESDNDELNGDDE